VDQLATISRQLREAILAIRGQVKRYRKKLRARQRSPEENYFAKKYRTLEQGPVVYAMRREGRSEAEVQGFIESELMKDPVYLAGRAELEDIARKRSEAYQKAAAPLLAELAAAGFRVRSVGELYGSKTVMPKVVYDYEKAIPLLMEWLPRIDNRYVKEEIVRALSVKWARPIAAPLFIREFERVPDEARTRFKDYPKVGSELGWAIGSALEVVADDSVFDDIVRLATDRKYRSDREMVVLCLAKMKKRRSEAVKVLISLLNDEDVFGFALVALRRMSAVEARSAIEPFLNHPHKSIRDEAKKAIAKFDKQAERSIRR
jgi:hypothetical protein